MSCLFVNYFFAIRGLTNSKHCFVERLYKFRGSQFGGSFCQSPEDTGKSTKQGATFCVLFVRWTYTSWKGRAYFSQTDSERRESKYKRGITKKVCGKNQTHHCRTFYENKVYKGSPLPQTSCVGSTNTKYQVKSGSCLGRLPFPRTPNRNKFLWPTSSAS